MNIDWSQVKTAEEKTADAVRQELEIARSNRAAAYVSEADPLFFKVQRGEAELADWKAKVADIRERFPYPEEG